MDWNAIIAALIGTVIGGIFGPIIVSRYSKTKRERDAALSDLYLKLADMTADQLQERINQVGVLVTENIATKTELSEVKAKQIDRDEQLGALEAHLAALQVQINKDAEERFDLRNKLTQFETRNRALWQYLVALLEHMKKHDVTPPEPPDALKSDPDIMRILGRAEK